ncbi:hypothetical protein T492DRAFT_871432, partial [Pavlovales sp. CCMP2436]
MLAIPEQTRPSEAQGKHGEPDEVVLDLHGASLGEPGAEALARRHLELGALT